MFWSLFTFHSHSTREPASNGYDDKHPRPILFRGPTREAALVKTGNLKVGKVSKKLGVLRPVNQYGYIREEVGKGSEGKEYVGELNRRVELRSRMIK